MIPMNNEFGDNYKLLWRKRDMQVAEVRNRANDNSGYRVIRVIQDDALMQKINMRFIVATWTDGKPYLIVASEFLQLPRDCQNAVIWHEVGHIHHEHHDTPDERGLHTQADIRASRIAYIEKSEVEPDEIEADDFAVSRVGKQPVLAFIELLLKTRPKGAPGGLNELGRKELKLRITRIQNLPD